MTFSKVIIFRWHAFLFLFSTCQLLCVEVKDLQENILLVICNLYVTRVFRYVSRARRLPLSNVDLACHRSADFQRPWRNTFVKL